MSNHEHWMRQAIAASRMGMSANAGGPFGAIIVQGEQLIATAYNRVTSTCDPTAHAEVEAIRQAAQKLGSFSLRGCTLYTSCYPCPMCLGAIYWARLDSVYYANSEADAAAIGFDDSLIYHELKREPAQRSIPMHPLLRSEALTVFQDWSHKQDKQPY